MTWRKVFYAYLAIVMAFVFVVCWLLAFGVIDMHTEDLWRYYAGFIGTLIAGRALAMLGAKDAE